MCDASVRGCTNPRRHLRHHSDRSRTGPGHHLRPRFRRGATSRHSSPTRAAESLATHSGATALGSARPMRSVEFRRGSSYVDHRETADGVSVRVGEGDEPIEGRYLIAADGGGKSSSVRLRVPDARTRTSTRDQRSFQCRPAPPPVVAARAGHLHFHAGRDRHHGVHSSPGEFVFQIPYFPPVQRVEGLPADECRRRIHDALGDRTIAVDIHSVQSWAMTAQSRHSLPSRPHIPRRRCRTSLSTHGGLGLNTGINDVHNLAWKLAWDVTGSAPPAFSTPTNRNAGPSESPTPNNR